MLNWDVEKSALLCYIPHSVLLHNNKFGVVGHRSTPTCTICASYPARNDSPLTFKWMDTVE